MTTRLLIYLFIITSLLYVTTVHSQSSWKEIKKTKHGFVEINFYDSENYIIEKDGVLSGIEYDLLTAFFHFLEKKYGVKIECKFKRAPSFGELFETVRFGKSGQFGACSFSITTDRLSKVNFSPKYMADIEVMVSSFDMDIVDDTLSFQKQFKNATAYVVKNTTFEEDFRQIQKIIPSLKVKYLNTGIEILEKIHSSENCFGFSELPNYLSIIKKGLRIKRQPLFKFERIGHGFIFPKATDWTEPVLDFFNDKSYPGIIKKILRKHLGNDIEDLLWQKEKYDKINEINLLNREIENQQIALEKKELETQNQSLMKRIVLIILGFILIITFVLFRNNKKNKKTNRLLQAQKNEIELQKHQIEEYNKNVISSINYAVRIQNSLLPTLEYIKEQIPDHFVIYLPKDIVSGDFYFVETFKDNAGRHLKCFAVGDCTGHGVPGAFMSILAINYLNQSLHEKQVNSAADALSFVSQRIKKTLNSKNQVETIRDGLDISFCVYDENSGMLYYAGANNPIYIIRKTGEEVDLIELKPDKQALGYADNFKPFTNQQIQLLKGDQVYLFTDGFADQFGGTEKATSGKKYKYSRFKNLLIQIQGQGMDEQKELILQEFTDWKGDMEQLDDICILGVKI